MGLLSANIDYNDENTRKILIDLLKLAKVEVGFSPRKAKLFVEVYESEEGGADIYFTCIRRPTRLDNSQKIISPMIFEFERAADLISAAAQVCLRYSHRIYKSSLYRINSRYRLLVYNLDYADKLSMYFLSEFGKMLADDEIFAAYTVEHGKEIIADCALEIIAEVFS